MKKLLTFLATLAVVLGVAAASASPASAKPDLYYAQVKCNEIVTVYGGAWFQSNGWWPNQGNPNQYGYAWDFGSFWRVQCDHVSGYLGLPYPNYDPYYYGRAVVRVDVYGTNAQPSVNINGGMHWILLSDRMAPAGSHTLNPPGYTAPFGCPRCFPGSPYA